MKKRKDFTLIELLVVIAIIAILCSVGAGIVNKMSGKDKGKNSPPPPPRPVPVQFDGYSDGDENLHPRD